MRVEPPPSLAVAMGTRPAATAPALPPLDPPGVFVVSHGLRATPKALVRVKLSVPNSGAAVLPTGTAPAARMRATFTESASTGPRPLNASDPCEVGMPAQSSRSFTPKGTPASGPGSSPAGHGGVDGLGRGPGQALVDVDERAQRVVGGGDGGQRLVEHVGGLALTATDGLCDLDGTRVHGLPPCRPGGRAYGSGTQSARRSGGNHTAVTTPLSTSPATP